MSGEPTVTLQRADSSVWRATSAASSRRLWRGFVNSVPVSTICRALQEVCQCCSRHNVLILMNAMFCATVAPHAFLKNRTYCAGEDHDSRNGGRWKRRLMRRTRCAGPDVLGQLCVARCTWAGAWAERVGTLRPCLLRCGERHSWRNALLGRRRSAPVASPNVLSKQRLASGPPPPAMQLQTKEPAGCTSGAIKTTSSGITLRCKWNMNPPTLVDSEQLLPFHS